MKEFVRLFDWKNYPSHVFVFAIPLAALGVMFALAGGVFAIIEKGDWIPLCINVVLLVFGAIALTPPIRMAMMLHKQNQPKPEVDDEHD